MGNCVGGFKEHKRKLQHHKKVRKIRICILGIDGAGKSTAICALASGEINNVLPTNGFTLHEFRFRKAEIIAYDLGGGERIRSIWKNYYSEVFGVIYVIDGSEEGRIEESGQLLKDVISDMDLMNKPFLIILNKKDRGKCIDEIQLTDRFNLHNLANRYQTQIRIEICQSNAGTGRMIDVTLKDGFEWLLEQIYCNYEILEKRVNEALEKLKHEKINDTDAIEVVAQSDKQQNHQMIISSQKATTNQIINSENRNEESKRKRCLRNAISPMDNLSGASNDLVKLKYPQIFEISSSGVSKRTTSVQTDQMFDMNGDIQSTSKPIRITQLVPMTVLRKEQPKHPARVIRRRLEIFIKQNNINL
uniref:ADP-ribosylation factor-like protein 13B n=1 Tax=Wuchereria bancrofti TaxID=6293 RepID=A0A1I8EUL2_WUCBA